MPQPISSLPAFPSFPTFGVELRHSQTAPFAALVRLHNKPFAEQPAQQPPPSNFSPLPLTLLSARACINANPPGRNPLGHAAPKLPPARLLVRAHAALAEASAHPALCPDADALMDFAEQQARNGTRTVTELCGSHAALQLPERVRRLQLAALHGPVGAALRSHTPCAEAVHSLATQPVQTGRFDTNALRQLDPLVHQAVVLHERTGELLRGQFVVLEMINGAIQPGSEAHFYLQDLDAEHGRCGDAVQQGNPLDYAIRTLGVPVSENARETLERRAVLGLLGDKVTLTDSDLQKVDKLGLATPAGRDAAASPLLRWLLDRRTLDPT